MVQWIFNPFTNNLDAVNETSDIIISGGGVTGTGSPTAIAIWDSESGLTYNNNFTIVGNVLNTAEIINTGPITTDDLEIGLGGYIYSNNWVTGGIIYAIDVGTPGLVNGSDFMYSNYQLKITSSGTPSMSQIRVQGNNLGGVSLLASGTDNNAIGFDTDVSGGKWIARDTSAFSIAKNLDTLSLRRNYSLTAGNAYTPLDIVTISGIAIDIGSGIQLNAKGGLVVGGSELGGYVPNSHKMQIVSAGNITPLMIAGGTGATEVWKDTTPTKAVSFGMAVPGVAITDDFVFSRFNGAAWAETMRLTNDTSNMGIGTTVPNKRLEINHVSGHCLRLTYNDSNGAAVNYADFIVSSTGNLNIAASSSEIYFSGNNLATSGLVSAKSFIGAGIVPIGGVIAWLKSFTNTPALSAGWVECNGQTISDPESVYSGLSIPNLNGSNSGVKRFLRGSETSGNEGGTECHSHCAETMSTDIITDVLGYNGANGEVQAGIDWCACTVGHCHTVTGGTTTEYNLPSYYEVVWIKRIK